MNLPPDTTVPIPPGTADLLREIGFTGEFSLVPLSGGANNRVYRVNGPESPLVLKSFYHAAGDKRDRFGAEKAFYDFLHAIDLKQATPRILAWSSTHRLGLFSWIEGRKLTPAEADRDAVGQALDFYLRLNARTELPTAEAVPIAAEACFSLGEHVQSVERRVVRLEKLEARTGLEQSVAALVKDRIRPALARAQLSLKKAFPEPDDLSLPKNRRVISPSDFGFHNALRGDKGRLVFFDFEYAGWDDPLKFVCDFLCQPEIPVPHALHDFCLELLDPAAPGGVRPEQVRALLPLYHLKWCCLMLNEFLPTERQRRLFAQELPSAQLIERQRRQYDKAQATLMKMSDLVCD
jgi:hypothetical protein